MESRKEDHSAAAERRRKLREAIAFKVYEFDAHGVDMNQRYKSKAIVADGSKDPGFRDDPELVHQQTTYPGARLPHVWLQKGAEKLSSLDLCGKGRFTLITSIGGDVWVDAAKAVSKATGVDIRAVKVGPGCDYEDHYGDWARIREVGDTGCVLVRPDQHVAWRAKKRPADATVGTGEGVFADSRQEGRCAEAAPRRNQPRKNPPSNSPERRGSQMAAKPIYFSEEQSEEAVISRMDPKKVDPRLYEVTKSLIKHLHGFIKEVEPTNEEWMAGIKFLTETGHMCTDWRQEFILLSDTLGVSMLVETINNRKPIGRNRDDRARPFLHRGRAAARQRRQHLARRQGRADGGHAAASPIPQGKPISRRAARRLAGQRGRLLRRPAEGHPARHESARHLHHRRRRPLLVPLGQAELLPDPRRRSGRQDAEGARPPPLPPGARPLHRRRKRVRSRSPRITSCQAIPISRATRCSA